MSLEPPWVPLEVPWARTMPVKLSREGVGEAAELTRAPLWGWCCNVAAISDCQAINLKLKIKHIKINILYN